MPQDSTPPKCNSLPLKSYRAPKRKSVFFSFFKGRTVQKLHKCKHTRVALGIQMPPEVWCFRFVLGGLSLLASGLDHPHL